jgi:hypothetical protein
MDRLAGVDRLRGPGRLARGCAQSAQLEAIGRNLMRPVRRTPPPRSLGERGGRGVRPTQALADSVGFLRSDPFVRARLQQIQRQSASVENLVMELANVKFRPQFFLRALPEFADLKLSQLVA